MSGSLYNMNKSQIQVSEYEIARLIRALKFDSFRWMYTVQVILCLE